MGWYCCVPLCKNEQKAGQSISGHSFPLKDKSLLKIWLIKIRRDVGKKFQVTKWTKVCSQHFKPHDFKPLLHTKKKILKPGVVPSMFVWNSQVKVNKRGERYEKLTDVPVISLCQHGEQASAPEPAEYEPDSSETAEETAAQALVLLSQENVDVEVENSRVHVASQCDINTNLEEENNTLTLTIESLKAQVLSLESIVLKKDRQMSYLKKKEFSLSAISGDSAVFCSYTGLPNYNTFSALLAFLQTKSQNLKYWRGQKTKEDVLYQKNDTNKPGEQRQLSTENEFFMVLLRLRVGSPRREVARLFGVTETYVTLTFTTWINFLFHEFKDLFRLPDRIVIKNATPKQFSDYPNTTIIVDCTEIRIERPTSIQRQKETFSNYKHYNTCKCLIGITPGGLITFVSQLYGGGVSDKQITKESGFYDLLRPGDEVMSDKGFEIEDQLPFGVKLNIPPKFQKKKNPQMPVNDVMQTRKIAKVRVHVERAIRRIKVFQILSGSLPISMAPLADQIVSVCAYLTNFQPALIR